MRKFFIGLMAFGLLGTIGLGAAWAEEAKAQDGQFAVDPSFRMPGEEVCEEGVRPVTAEEKQEIEAALKELYDACKAKDLDKVMDLLSVCIEDTAQEYAGRHQEDPDAAQEIRDAFRYFFRDVFNHEEYELDPYDIEGIYYVIDDNEVITVASPLPIISSTKGLQMSDSNDDYYMIVRLRLERFDFRKIDGKWRIVKMDIF